jgi:flagellar basal-body rod protein FlgF
MRAVDLSLLSNQNAMQRAMDVVANNIANASTTGYKRTGIDFQTVLSRTSSGQTFNFVVDRSTYRDTREGSIEPTGNSLDIALQGNGYLQVQTQNGIRYTHSGSMTIDAKGQIVTQSGDPVLTDSGQPIVIPDTASDINIGADGSVSVKNGSDAALTQLGRIGVVKFDNEQDVKAEGQGLYATSQAAQPDTTTAIVQGSLERSNVDPVLEMTEMVKIMRSYEQASNLMGQENTRLSDAYSRLSKTTA